MRIACTTCYDPAPPHHAPGELKSLEAQGWEEAPLTCPSCQYREEMTDPETGIEWAESSCHFCDQQLTADEEGHGDTCRPCFNKQEGLPQEPRT